MLYYNITYLSTACHRLLFFQGFPIAIAIPAARNGNGSDTAARNQTNRAGMNGISHRITRWNANSAQAMTYAMTCGAPPPLFKATAPIENPTTGPPGVAAPAITAASTPGQPLFGPSHPVMTCCGMIAAMYPEPITPRAMRGTMLTKSMAP